MIIKTNTNILIHWNLWINKEKNRDIPFWAWVLVLRRIAIPWNKANNKNKDCQEQKDNHKEKSFAKFGL